MDIIKNIRKEITIYCGVGALILIFCLWGVYLVGIQAKAYQVQAKQLLNLKEAVLQIENEFIKIKSTRKYFVSAISVQQGVLDDAIRNILNQGHLDSEQKTKIKHILIEKNLLYSKIGQFFKLDTNNPQIHTVLGNIEESLSNLQNNLNSLEKLFFSKAFLSSHLVALYFLEGLLFLIVIILYVRFKMDHVLKQKANKERYLKQKNQLEFFLKDLKKFKQGIINNETITLEGAMGEISDEFYKAKHKLRSSLSILFETANQAARASKKTELLASEQGKTSGNQAREIVSVTATINTIASAIAEVAHNAEQSTQVSESFIAASQNGLTIVNNTIANMEKMKEQVEETANRIKRLGESSQEIGDSVSLIEDLAEQTNILSLNASIQAASASDTGKGFSVIADEIQRLSERASMATKEVEGLVRTIQNETKQAVVSMEETTKQVCDGLALIRSAGSSLGDIEQVVNDLSTLLQNIAKKTQQQKLIINQLSKAMDIIQQMSTETVSGTELTIGSIGLVCELSEELAKISEQFYFSDQNDEKTAEH